MGVCHSLKIMLDHIVNNYDFLGVQKHFTILSSGNKTREKLFFFFFLLVLVLVFFFKGGEVDHVRLLDRIILLGRYLLLHFPTVGSVF